MQENKDIKNKEAGASSDGVPASFVTILSKCSLE
jgi:hypothetical protein